MRFVSVLRQRSVSHIKEALGAANLKEEREEEERHDRDEDVVEAEPPHKDGVELTDSPVRSQSATRSVGKRRQAAHRMNATVRARR